MEYENFNIEESISTRNRRAREYSRDLRDNAIRKVVFSVLIGILIFELLFLFFSASVNASNVVSCGYSVSLSEQNKIYDEVTTNEEIMLENDFKAVEMTYYTWTGNPCANTKYPRYGVCAYAKEYIGKTAIVYDLEMKLIGYFEIYDTGYGRTESNGNGTIENGNCIDIYMDSHGEGKDFIKEHGNQVYIKIVDAKG